MAVRIYRNLHRSLFVGLTAAYFGGQAGSLLDANGDPLTGSAPPPQVIGALDAIILTVGYDPVTVDLATVFSGATSYETTALPAGVTRSGAIITVTAGVLLSATTITIRARNAGGLSDPVTLSVEVLAAAPELETPASISPASGPVGTVFTITPATWAGTGPFTRAGELQQAGIVVATRSGSSIAPFIFTSTEEPNLEWFENITGPGGSASASASATVAPAPVAPAMSGGSMTIVQSPAMSGGSLEFANA